MKLKPRPRPTRDETALDVAMAIATVEHLFADRDMASLTDGELEAITAAGFTVAYAVIDERARRKGGATC